MVEPLPSRALSWTCPSEGLGFATTDELADIDPGTGQHRVTEAMDFALRMGTRATTSSSWGPRDWRSTMS